LGGNIRQADTHLKERGSFAAFIRAALKNVKSINSAGPLPHPKTLEQQASSRSQREKSKSRPYRSRPVPESKVKVDGTAASIFQIKFDPEHCRRRGIDNESNMWIVI